MTVKTINDEKGAILIVTLGFVLVFTMLGLASIHLSGIQNVEAEKQVTSTEAIWVADAGIQVLKTKMPPVGTLPLNYSNNFGITCADGVTCKDYAAQIVSLVPGYAHRWITTSAGTVQRGQNNTENTRTRTIEAVISEFIVNAVTTNGQINGDCIPDGSGDIQGTCEQNAGITLMNTFGMNYTNTVRTGGGITVIATNPNPDVTLAVNNSYTDSNYKSAPYSGLTVITSNNGVEAKWISNTASDPVFLIIDCPSTFTGNCFDSNGAGDIYGIVWVRGNIDMTGTRKIHGSLFVEGTRNDRYSGNNLVEYDENIINDILDDLGGLLTDPVIVSWKEI